MVELGGLSAPGAHQTGSEEGTSDHDSAFAGRLCSDTQNKACIRLADQRRAEVSIQIQKRAEVDNHVHKRNGDDKGRHNGGPKQTTAPVANLETNIEQTQALSSCMRLVRDGEEEPLCTPPLIQIVQLRGPYQKTPNGVVHATDRSNEEENLFGRRPRGGPQPRPWPSWAP